MILRNGLAAAGVAGAVALVALSTSATAELAPTDPAAIFSIQGENASISSARLTDRFYTNGIMLGWTSPTDYAPAVAGIGRTIFGEGRQRVAVDISQQLYTPADTAIVNPSKKDRPYSGVLLARFSETSDTMTSRSTIGLSLGIVGPSALGEQIQNGFHDLIGQGHNNGWNTQLHDEPVANIDISRVWRLPTGSVLGLETDALPAAAVDLGTLRIAGTASVNFRLGQGLESDFGAPRIRALAGGNAFTRPVNGGIGWYVFAGLTGQAVARDVTLDGNTWRNTNRGVDLTPLVGQAQAGLAVLAYGARLSYTHVIETQEFKHQRGGPHQFGVLALSVRF